MNNLASKLLLVLEYLFAVWGIMQLAALTIITLLLFIGIYSLTKLYNLTEVAVPTMELNNDQLRKKLV